MQLQKGERVFFQYEVLPAYSIFFQAPEHAATSQPQAAAEQRPAAIRESRQLYLEAPRKKKTLDREGG